MRFSLPSWLIWATPCMQMLSHATPCQPDPDLAWYRREVEYLASLKSRLTGSETHSQFLDHIQEYLENLGQKVETDWLSFNYNLQSSSKLVVAGEEIQLSSALEYSGNTDSNGVSGHLVDLTGPSTNYNWALAAGNVAVLNLTTTSPKGKVTAASVAVTLRSALNGSLDPPKAAGVKAIIAAFQGTTAANAANSYNFGFLYSGLPVVFVAGDAAETVIRSAKRGSVEATVTLEGTNTDQGRTRTIYTVYKGTESKNETVILSTHTDGTNTLQENGYIALLSRAKHLAKHPPRRTTVLVFVTGHLVQTAFSAKYRSTNRWLTDHPEFWTGAPYKAVAASCVEHLGAVIALEDAETNFYEITSTPAPETIYAATSELAALTRREWRGVSRGDSISISDPVLHQTQSGEGFAYSGNDIPNISLVNGAGYLLVEYPHEFDETTLVDVPTVAKQVRSLHRVWNIFDTAPAESFGTVDFDGGKE